jgi:hypothetical protein
MLQKANEIVAVFELIYNKRFPNVLFEPVTYERCPMTCPRSKGTFDVTSPNSRTSTGCLQCSKSVHWLVLSFNKK